MFRFIPTATLAWLLAGCAQPGAHTSLGAADPQPASDGKTIPLHEHQAGMDMQGMQCTAGGEAGKGCCAGMDKAGRHASHAGMTMHDGCCCGHGARAGEPAACRPDGTCGCCHHKEAT